MPVFRIWPNAPDGDVRHTTAASVPMAIHQRPDIGSTLLKLVSLGRTGPPIPAMRARWRPDRQRNNSFPFQLPIADLAEQ